MRTRTIPSNQFQHHVGATFDAIRNTEDTVIVTAHGRPQVVVVSAHQYDALLTARRELGVLQEAERARQQALREGNR
jgi:prevent-host-death family protein